MRNVRHVAMRTRIPKGNTAAAESVILLNRLVALLMSHGQIGMEEQTN